MEVFSPAAVELRSSPETERAPLSPRLCPAQTLVTSQEIFLISIGVNKGLGNKNSHFSLPKKDLK